MSAALSVTDLHAGYGQAAVLLGIGFEVAAGEIVSLVGANGAGKTTLLNVIAGVLQPTSGAIAFDGEDITRARAHELPSKGLVLVPEGGRVTARGSRALTGQNKNRGRADAADPAPVLFFGLFWRRGVDCRFCAYRLRARKGALCSDIRMIAGR